MQLNNETKIPKDVLKKQSGIAKKRPMCDVGLILKVNPVHETTTHMVAALF